MNTTSKIPESPPVEHILDAAMSVFAEEGFAGARVDEIARRAGVNKAMLYYHVGDKAALYEKVLVRNFDRLLEAVAEAAQKEAEPADRLRAVIHSLTDLTDELDEHPRIVMHEIAAGGANLPIAALMRMAQAFAAVAGIVSEGIEQGSMRDVNPLLTHVTLISAVIFGSAIRPVGARMRAMDVPVELPNPAEYAEHLTDLLLHGLLKTGESS